MARRESDSDAETMLDGTISGQQAYWAGKPFNADAASFWRNGWLLAAAEAQRTIAEHKPLLLGRPDIQAALNEAGAAIKQLMPSKATPRQRSLSNSAQSLIEVALERIKPAPPAKSPTEARKPSARASRAR